MAGVSRVRLSSLVALTLAASLVLAGCGADDDEPDAAPPPPAPTRTTPPADPAEATGSAPPEQSPEPSSSPARKPGRHKVGTLQPRMRLETAAHLLDADGLPPLGHGSWSVAATGPEDPEQDTVVGACQKTLLGTIGAVETVRRTFTAPGRLQATQVVARFADSRSAWRAHEVLAAWRADCAERVGGDVGPLEPLDVHAGTGGWDRERRPSEVRLDRLLELAPGAVRREGAALDRAVFERVVSEARRFHTLGR